MSGVSGNGSANGRRPVPAARRTERGAGDGTPLTCDDAALERDRAADERDRAAEERDRVARRRDAAERRAARALEELSPGGATLAWRDATRRAQAAADRAAAASDRSMARRDREAAAWDRESAARELALAAMDELTWTRRRGPGLEELEREIERSERTGAPLTIAYLDVDGLKAVNDANGHAAGDRLLTDVVDALRAELRAYDLVVRMGGDEFMCILAGADEGFVRARFAGIVDRLHERSPDASFSVGYAQHVREESSEALVQRADRELLAGRTGERNAPSARS